VTADLDARRVQLLELRQRVGNAARGLLADDGDDGELNSAAGDQHMADHATALVDREVGESLGENADQIVAEIDAAIARIDDGTYGRCATCGEPIARERLEAVPYATLCVEHKRLEERS
jgi:DnaK suppressor protein